MRETHLSDLARAGKHPLEPFQLAEDAILDIDAIWLYLLEREGLETADRIVTEIFKGFLPAGRNAGDRTPPGRSHQSLGFVLPNLLLPGHLSARQRAPADPRSASRKAQCGADFEAKAMSTENAEPWKKYRKLPLKIWYRPMDLSAETERMLDEAMVRLDVDKPDLAIHAALKKFLEDHPKAGPRQFGGRMSQAVSPRRADPLASVSNCAPDAVSSPLTRVMYARALDDFFGWWTGRGGRRSRARRAGLAGGARSEGVRAGEREPEALGGAEARRGAAYNGCSIRQQRRPSATSAAPSSGASAPATGLPSARPRRCSPRPMLDQPGKRDRAILAVLVGCGLRRDEAVRLTFDHIQQRDGRWCVVGLVLPSHLQL